MTSERRGKALLFGGALFLASCAGGPLGWKHVATTHFDLYTTGGSHTYGPVLERLEMVHLALSQTFFQNTDVPGFEVFVYEPEEAMYILGDYGGRFVAGLGPKGTLVMKNGASSEDIDPLAAHELAHGFIRATFKTIPVWFNEGLATYLGSLRMRDGLACFGGRDRMRSGEAVRGQLIPVRELFAARGAEFHDASWEHSHYASGWAVIHYLLHGEGGRLRRRFDAFNKHFADPGSVETVSFEAWANVFPDIPIEQLDTRVKDHLRNVFDRPGGKCMGIPFKEPPPPVYKVEPANMSLVNEREAWLKANRLRLKW
ncbi:MAG TPA: DUF1570 domain-containing protein [Polyangia bacterium]|nr:DUF1570 domain-containing protein [Polyangia bacterium]